MGSTNDVWILVGTPGFMASPLLWAATSSCSSAWPRTPPDSPFSHSSKPSYVHAPVLAFALPTVSLSTRADIEQLYGEHKLLTHIHPSLRRSIPPTRPCYPARRCHPTQPLFLAHTSPALVSLRKRPSTPMDPCLIALAAWATALLERTLLGGRLKLPSTICLTSILGRTSSCGVTWIGFGASVLPGNATPRRYIYICVEQDV